VAGKNGACERSRGLRQGVTRDDRDDLHTMRVSEGGAGRLAGRPPRSGYPRRARAASIARRV
jgi:hypothetical protein